MVPRISIAVPTYEADGRGVVFIKKIVDSFLQQTYKNLELVISDHSVNDDIKNLILNLNNDRIVYIKNENDRGLQVENMNNAINNSTGDYIKLLNHDDYFDSPEIIESMVRLLNDGFKWVISSCKHYNYENGEFYNFLNPVINNDGKHLLDGLNYVGCSSVGLIPKEVLLDVNVKYMADCELWYRMFISFGQPGILGGHNIVIGTGNHTLTTKFLSKENEMKNNDINYCKLKYKDK